MNDTRLTLVFIVGSFVHYLDKTYYYIESMDNLLRAMQIIDGHSDKLPEGDYLELCNLLKDAYNKRSDPVFFFDYDAFDIPPIGSSMEIFTYFHDMYFEKALDLDSDYIDGQIQYLDKEFNYYRPIRRVTKNIKDSVLKHYCNIYDLPHEDMTLEQLEIGKDTFHNMCKTYINVENHFRMRYREAIEKRIQWLEEANERMESL